MFLYLPFYNYNIIKMTNSIGARIKELRVNKSISQKKLAEHLNISQSAYAKIEKGISKLDVNRLVEIAQILEVDPNELLYNDQAKTVNFTNNKISGFGYVNNNYYSDLKEMYEQSINQLKEEVAFLRKMIESKK